MNFGESCEKSKEEGVVAGIRFPGRIREEIWEDEGMSTSSFYFLLNHERFGK